MDLKPPVDTGIPSHDASTVPTRKLLWFVPLLMYATFAYWYTNTDGPLTPDEIAAYTNQAREIGFDEEWLEPVQEFMASDTGNQFFMVNVVALNETAAAVDGADAGESSRQLLDRYMGFIMPQLLRRASHPMFAGAAVSPSVDAFGIDNAEDWDAVMVMRYRSRRDLLEIAVQPEFLDKHRFKVAAMSKTFAYPNESRLYLSDPRFLLALLLLAVVSITDILVYGRRR